jgi:hypothetical protein
MSVIGVICGRLTGGGSLPGVGAQAAAAARVPLMSATAAADRRYRGNIYDAR